MKKRIAPQVEQLDKRFILAARFFDSIAEVNFMWTVRELLDGVSMTFNVHSCDFPTPGDEPFVGVKFTLDLSGMERELLVSYDQFLVFLKMAAELYLEDRPADREQVKVLFEAKSINYDAIPSSALEPMEA